MATFRVTSGVLQGETIEGGGDRPGLWPPGSGIDMPGHPLPEPPPGVWPPPVPAHPIVPAPPQTPPGMIWPGRPTHPIAGPPDRPSQGPGFPTPPIANPPGGTPPGQPGQPPTGGGSPPVAGHPLPQKFWTLALIPGYGWYYICVDPAAAFQVEPPHPDHSLPGGQPDQPGVNPQRRPG